MMFWWIASENIFIALENNRVGLIQNTAFKYRNSISFVKVLNAPLIAFLLPIDIVKINLLGIVYFHEYLSISSHFIIKIFLRNF